MTGKTASLLFLFFLISPLYAQPFPEPQPSMEDEGLFFFEELFVFEESLMGGELLLSDEAFSGEETSLSEEPLLSEEAPSNEEPLLSGETPSAEETLPGKEIPLNEEALLAEHQPSQTTPERSGEGSPPQETPPDEDPYFDDDDFFFEAPPLVFEVPTYEMRSLNTIFPNFSPSQRITAMSYRGIRNSFTKDEPPTLIPNPDLGIDLLGSAMKKNPSHLIEALAVVPYNDKELDLLDIYNALGRVEKIKDYPATINGNPFYIFTESTRIESARRRRAIPDPSPAITLPFSDTMYLCLKEINFGNLFIRADISISMYGITYSMTNFTDVRYFLLPLVRAEKYITVIYLEPITEGILIYSITGFYMPGFISDRVNLTPNINRRIQIFVDWITDGLREQESVGINY